jgi:hypothetical protein
MDEYSKEVDMIHGNSGRRLRMVGGSVGTILATAIVGCGASDSSSPKGDAGSTGAVSTTSGSGTTTGGTTTTGTGGGGVQPLPVIVDAFFAPSGYMEDARNGNATMTPMFDGDDTTCQGNRAPGGRGFCHIVTFSMWAAAGIMWGGVFWQYPANNWGTTPGLKVAPGATKIRFKAKGDKGGEIVGFFAGIKPANAPAPNPDTFEVMNVDQKLTTDWQEYSLPLPPGTSYAGGVVGPFGWGIGANGNTLPVKFYLDDITFE